MLSAEISHRAIFHGSNCRLKSWQVGQGGRFAPALALTSSGVRLDSETIIDRAS